MIYPADEKHGWCWLELLQSRPNFLVLDEPTNHMDVQAKETLESAFQAYTGTILFVSHDRYFIRQVAQTVLSLMDGGPMYYPFQVRALPGEKAEGERIRRRAFSPGKGRGRSTFSRNAGCAEGGTATALRSFPSRKPMRTGNCGLCRKNWSRRKWSMDGLRKNIRGFW